MISVKCLNTKISCIKVYYDYNGFPVKIEDPEKGHLTLIKRDKNRIQKVTFPDGLTYVYKYYPEKEKNIIKTVTVFTKNGGPHTISHYETVTNGMYKETKIITVYNSGLPKSLDIYVAASNVLMRKHKTFLKKNLSWSDEPKTENSFSHPRVFKDLTEKSYTNFKSFDYKTKTCFLKNEKKIVLYQTDKQSPLLSFISYGDTNRTVKLIKKAEVGYDTQNAELYTNRITGTVWKDYEITLYDSRDFNLQKKYRFENALLQNTYYLHRGGTAFTTRYVYYPNRHLMKKYFIKENGIYAQRLFKY